MVWDGLWFWFGTFGAGSGILRIPEKRLVGASCGPPFPWAPWVNQSDLRLEAKKGVVVAKMDVTVT